MLSLPFIRENKEKVLGFLLVLYLVMSFILIHGKMVEMDRREKIEKLEERIVLRTGEPVNVDLERVFY